MKKIIATCLVSVVLLFVAGSARGETAQVKIRIGWQVPWATQGQIVQAWKHTDILAKNGLAVEFVGRTYGPDLNVAALAGEVDVVLTADQPAAALFSKNKGWIGVARLMYNRTSTYVPPKSPVKSIADLKGGVIGIPIGAAAERVTVEALERAGLDPKKDVKIVNLGIREQGPLVYGAGKDAADWGSIDALSGFDPVPAIFESLRLVRTLDVGRVVSLVLMNEEFIARHPGVAERLVRSLVDAYDYYRQHVDQTNAWFMEEAGIKENNQAACNIAASIEPNLKAASKKDIRVWLTEEDFDLMQKGADFLAPKLRVRVDMRGCVTNRYAKP